MVIPVNWLLSWRRRNQTLLLITVPTARSDSQLNRIVISVKLTVLCTCRSKPCASLSAAVIWQVDRSQQSATLYASIQYSTIT